jgi:hypothetical protein
LGLPVGPQPEVMTALGGLGSCLAIEHD